MINPYLKNWWLVNQPVKNGGWTSRDHINSEFDCHVGTICSRIFFWNHDSPISSSVWEPGKESKRSIQKSEYVFSLLSSKWPKMMVQFTATNKSPQDPCREYSPTFGWYLWLNVGKYTSPMGVLPLNEASNSLQAIVLPIVGLYCWGGMPYAPWNCRNWTP